MIWIHLMYICLDDDMIYRTFATATNKGQPDAFPESVTQVCESYERVQ